MASEAIVEPELLALLRCPFCRVEPTLGSAELVCPSCGRRFGVEDGIPLMLHEELPGAREKLREVAGWPEKARAEGWYEPDDEVDAQLPFLSRLGWEDTVWRSNEYSFGALLERAARPGLRVLELGAAKAWAAPHWRERGCEYVATDILVDAKIGLGRGAFYGSFGRVQADGEHLPFADRCFDVTYCCATLHHALDLQAMVREMVRVTAPGGVVAALNEGTRGVFRSGENPDQEAEKALGINEHVHTAAAYIIAFLRAGLVLTGLELADGRAPHSPGRRIARLPWLGPRLAAFASLSYTPYGGMTLFARRRGTSTGAATPAAVSDGGRGTRAGRSA